eukprot:COSAG04_NODE_19206_length_422_cov_0.473684_1_plen_116_part_01
MLDASKDFWDSKKSRRILWGWAQAGHTGKTLPRELTYDPRLKQIVQTPVPELQQVRSGPLASADSRGWAVTPMRCCVAAALEQRRGLRRHVRQGGRGAAAVRQGRRQRLRRGRDLP